MRIRAETLLIIAMSIFAGVGWVAVEIAHRQTQMPRTDVGLLPVLEPPPPPEIPDRPVTPSAWFEAVRNDCTPQDAVTAVRRSPPPQTEEGRIFEAACYALAGRVDDARRLVEGLPVPRRRWAAGIIFDAGHPTADAGDEVAAGPLMELVVEFWPDHYMALYHAGAGAHQMGDGKRASGYLTRFLEEYPIADGWRSRAEGMLERIRAGG